MRSTVIFLIGAVFGATGVLMWVHEKATPPGLQAAERGAISAQPTAAAKVTAGPPTVQLGVLQMPVLGFKAEDLRSEFRDARGGGRTHDAIDIRAPRGTPVVAVADGTIKKLFTSKAGGLTIYHYDQSEMVCYYYAHLDRYAGDLQEGMSVKRGSVIGYVGTTGNAPPGTPHLHFAVTKLPPTKEWWKGTAVDPYPLLLAR